MCYFNSTMVQLIGGKGMKTYDEPIYFNSTMVQLIAASLPVDPTFVLFQFYYGSINSSPAAQMQRYLDAFQFYYGSINSYSDYKYIPSSVQFQFYYGSINRGPPNL